MIMQFSRVEKDFINDETIEIMAPYLELEVSLTSPTRQMFPIHPPSQR